MRRKYLFVFLPVLILGCHNRIPETRYFTLNYPLPYTESGNKKPVAEEICVRELDIALPYDRRQIAYRLSPYETRYYNYSLWSAKPNRLMTELLVKYLANSRLFSAIRVYHRGCQGDLVLTGKVEAVEEVDRKDGYYAHLNIIFNLYRGDDKEAVWTYGMDLEEKVEERPPLGVVETMSGMFFNGIEDMVENMERFLRGKLKK